MSDLIALDDVRRVYEMGDAEVRALDGVTLTIATGSYVAIMGPSGSGKSTLMNLIGCLDTPSSGSYRLKGQEISKMEDDDLARIRNREIGFVFHTYTLRPRSTAPQTVALPLVYSGLTRGERRRRAEAAMEAVGLTDRMHHRPNELSGGQRQRVAIARSLVNGPSLLLADEPTGNLDSKTGVEIMALFERLHASGNAVILVTHDPELAMHADRMVGLRDGRVITDSSA